MKKVIKFKKSMAKPNFIKNTFQTLLLNNLSCFRKKWWAKNNKNLLVLFFILLLYVLFQTKIFFLYLVGAILIENLISYKKLDIYLYTKNVYFLSYFQKPELILKSAPLNLVALCIFFVFRYYWKKFIHKIPDLFLIVNSLSVSLALFFHCRT